MAQRLAQNSGEQQPLRRVGAPRRRPLRLYDLTTPGHLFARGRLRQSTKSATQYGLPLRLRAGPDRGKSVPLG